MARNRKWTKSEDDYLRENFNSLKIKEIAKKINRTENAINWRGKVLGLSEPRGRSWKNEEIALLLTDLPEKEIAEKLNRTVTAVRKKRAIERSKKGVHYKRQKIKDIFDLAAIEKDVPMIDRFSKSGQHFATLSALKIGESYEFPKEEYPLVRNQIQYLSDKMFKTKKWTETTRRVWRIE